MALDGIYLSSLIEEIKDIIIDCRVDKVTQPEKDEIILSFKKNRKIYKLLISSSSNYPRIHFTDFNKENPAQAPIFCMVLRKYLNTATVLDVRQLNSDRLLVIDFKSSDELGFDSVYSLIIEIMGRHSNISLVRTTGQFNNGLHKAHYSRYKQFSSFIYWSGIYISTYLYKTRCF